MRRSRLKKFIFPSLSPCIGGGRSPRVVAQRLNLALEEPINGQNRGVALPGPGAGGGAALGVDHDRSFSRWKAFLLWIRGSAGSGEEPAEQFFVLTGKRTPLPDQQEYDLDTRSSGRGLPGLFSFELTGPGPGLACRRSAEHVGLTIPDG